MGALIGTGTAFKELMRVFNKPESKEYAIAQNARELFGGIGVGVGNWQDLVAAYKAAGVLVGPPWVEYLQKMSPENIYTIALARFDGLTRGVAMRVDTHPAGGANKVIVSIEADGSITIDSPFP
jgi:hypothetical protein